MTSPTLLFVPGLRGFVADHWQTLEAPKFERAATVPPLETDGLSRIARVENFQRALQAIDGPVVLVAHSAGCMIVAHWAATHRDSKIIGALLATPADLEASLPEGYPTQDLLEANGWRPVPSQPLPFDCIVGASRNDPLCTFDRAERIAKDWTAGLVDLGAVGHLNPAAGYGPWLDLAVHLQKWLA